MNKLTRLVLCTLLPPLLQKVADILEEETRETKTKWDDLGVEALRQLAQFLPQLCREISNEG